MVPPVITVQMLAEPRAPGPAGPAGTLVLGPSLGTSVSRLWGSVAATLAAAAPTRQVLGWDLPGHGSGTVAPAGAEFSLHELAEAVLAAVTSFASSDDCSDSFVDTSTPWLWAGDSVGGAVCLDMALHHPDRVAAAMPLCSAARFGEPAGWHDRAALVRAQGMAPMVASSPARWFGSAITAAGDGRVEAALRDLAAVDPESYAQVCGALASHDLRAALSAIEVPVLAVAGADDVATPVSVLEEIASAVPRARLEVLAGVGHLAPYEDPAAVAALLLELLDV